MLRFATRELQKVVCKTIQTSKQLKTNPHASFIVVLVVLVLFFVFQFFFSSHTFNSPSLEGGMVWDMKMVDWCGLRMSGRDEEEMMRESSVNKRLIIKKDPVLFLNLGV